MGLTTFFDEVVSFRVDKKNYLLLKSYSEKTGLPFSSIIRSSLVYFFENKADMFEENFKPLVDINKKELDASVLVEKNRFLLKKGFMKVNTMVLLKKLIRSGASLDLLKGFLDNQIQMAKIMEDKETISLLEVWRDEIEDIILIVQQGRFHHEVMVPEGKEWIFNMFKENSKSEPINI